MCEKSYEMVICQKMNDSSNRLVSTLAGITMKKLGIPSFKLL